VGNVLHGLDYSPWTERARWALDHHRIAHRFRQHTPMLGELGLRWRARTPDGSASVPLWVGARGRVMGSLPIMRLADTLGESPRLMAEERRVIEIDRLVDPALRAARSRVVARTLGDREALHEAARATVPGVLTPVAWPVAARGARFLARKHGADPETAEHAHDDAIRAALLGIRAALDGGEHLGEAFGGADIVAATLLQAVVPAHVPWIDLGPATRRAWTSESLAEEFADLVAWRDGLYRRHRQG
jgi:glutathione S-transferase